MSVVRCVAISLALLVSAVLLGCVSVAVAEEPETTTQQAELDADGWEVLAASYGRSTYPLSELVDGEKSGRHPMGWFFWIVRQGDVVILVDCGFRSEKKAKKWGIKDFRTPLEVLDELSLTADDVDHVILSHGHWDHIGGLRLFDTARVWIREAEVDWLEKRVGDDGKRRSGGFRRKDLKIVRKVDEDGRLERMGEGELDVLPGIRAYDAGKHTAGSQWLTVQSGEHTIVLASDNAYLYRNIEEPVAIGASVSTSGNLAAIEKMRELASDIALIIPGHDPEVLDRFSEIAPRIVKIAPP